MTSIWKEVRRDYGINATSDGVRHFDRVTGPAERLDTPEAYVRAVIRALRWEHPKHHREYWYDWRIVAVGHNHVPPREFARHLPEWWEYWSEVAERPEPVGSSYNVEPSRAYTAFRLGWPASLVRRANELGLNMLISGRPTRGRLRRVSTCLRAASRESMRTYCVAHSLEPNNKLLYALGRLCPELQTVALSTVTVRYEFRDDEPKNKLLMKHINWEAVAAAQKEMLENPAARIRHTHGKRRSALWEAALPPEWYAISGAFSTGQLIGLAPLVTGKNPVKLEHLWKDYYRWYPKPDHPPKEWEGEVIGWHCVRPDMRLRFDRRQEVVGVGSVVEHTGPIELCKSGLHASFSKEDAKRYSFSGWILCKVRCSGRFIFGADKFVCTRREILEIFPSDIRKEIKAA